MDFNEILKTMTDLLTPTLLLLTAIAGIIEKSENIAKKPVSKFLGFIGEKMNAGVDEKVSKLQQKQDELQKKVESIQGKQDDMQARQLAQEAYYLNDFYYRHINKEKLTREQYELAISMFEKHLAIGANSVNRLHLDILKAHYKHVWGD